MLLVREAEASAGHQAVGGERADLELGVLRPQRGLGAVLEEPGLVPRTGLHRDRVQVVGAEDLVFVDAEVRRRVERRGPETATHFMLEWQHAIAVLGGEGRDVGDENEVDVFDDVICVVEGGCSWNGVS